MSKNLQELGKLMEFEVKYPEPKRGEIYKIDLNETAVGTVHIATKSRPGLIIQNNKGNLYADTVIVALMTSQPKRLYPMQYKFILDTTESIIMFEQILTVDKTRLISKMGELTHKQMLEAEEKLMYSLELNKFSLSNVKDIDVINRTNVKTKTEEYISFTIDIQFINQENQTVQIKLDKLKEFDGSINADINFDELKRRLDCCRGLNWLVNNNEL